MADHGFGTTLATTRTAAMAAALAATLGLAAASWVVAVWQMRGMDMGVATRLGSFASFIAVWVVMMAAMMLPGAAPAVFRRAQASGRVRAVPLFGAAATASAQDSGWPVLRRLEHRADADAGGARGHERHLDVGDHCPRPGPKAPAAQSR